MRGKATPVSSVHSFIMEFYHKSWKKIEVTITAKKYGLTNQPFILKALLKLGYVERKGKSTFKWRPDFEPTLETALRCQKEALRIRNEYKKSKNETLLKINKPKVVVVNKIAIFIEHPAGAHNDICLEIQNNIVSLSEFNDMSPNDARDTMHEIIRQLKPYYKNE